MRERERAYSFLGSGGADGRGQGDGEGEREEVHDGWLSGCWESFAVRSGTWCRFVKVEVFFLSIVIEEKGSKDENIKCQNEL